MVRGRKAKGGAASRRMSVTNRRDPEVSGSARHSSEIRLVCAGIPDRLGPDEGPVAQKGRKHDDVLFRNIPDREWARHMPWHGPPGTSRKLAQSAPAGG